MQRFIDSERAHEVASACGFGSRVRKHISIIRPFLSEKDTAQLMQVTKKLRNLIIDELNLEKQSADFEMIMTLGVGSFQRPSFCEGPISYIGDLRDLRSLGLVCTVMLKYCHNRSTVTRMMRRNLDNVLTKFGLDRKNHGRGSFDETLIESGAIVGGSILLQCATGVMYDESKTTDIDIYVTEGREGGIEWYLHRNAYESRGAPSDMDPEVGYGGNYIERVDTYEHAKSGMKVDLVIMKEEMHPRFAIGAYDFTFLMGLYTGAIFELWFPMDIMQRQGRYNTVRNQLTRIYNVPLVAH